MEYRKLVEFGKASYVITLPKSWIKRNKLKKGSTVKIETKEDFLVLTTENTKTDFSNNKEERRIILDTDKLLEKGFENQKEEEKSYFISMLIFSAYVNGYNVIIIKGNKNMMKDIVEEIIGLEVVEETSEKIITRFLIDIKEVSLDKMLDRTDVMFKTLITYFKDPKDWEELLIFEKKRLRSLCLLSIRVATECLQNFEMRKILGVSSLDAGCLRELFRQFRIMGSIIAEVTKFLTENKPNAFEKKILYEVIEKIETYHNKMIKVYKEPNSQSQDLAKLAGESYKIRVFIEEQEKIIRKKNKDPRLCLRMLYSLCYNQGTVNILLEELKKH